VPQESLLSLHCSSDCRNVCCLLVIASDYRDIKRTRLRDVLAHPMPYKFRVCADVIKYSPRAECPLDIIQLYCPECEFLWVLRHDIHCSILLFYSRTSNFCSYLCYMLIDDQWPQSYFHHCCALISAILTTDSLQGRLATRLRYDGIILQIFCWVYQRKNFKNWLISGKDIYKGVWCLACLTYGVMVMLSVEPVF